MGIRISRGHYGDLCAAAMNVENINPELAARFKEMEKDFEIVDEPQPGEFMMDLSIMFMYPNKITPLEINNGSQTHQSP